MARLQVRLSLFMIRAFPARGFPAVLRMFAANLEACCRPTNNAITPPPPVGFSDSPGQDQTGGRSFQSLLQVIRNSKKGPALFRSIALADDSFATARMIQRPKKG